MNLYDMLHKKPGFPEEKERIHYELELRKAFEPLVGEDDWKDKFAFAISMMVVNEVKSRHTEFVSFLKSCVLDEKEIVQTVIEQWALHNEGEHTPEKLATAILDRLEVVIDEEEFNKWLDNYVTDGRTINLP